MKKFFAVMMLVLCAFTFAMFSVTTTYASPQTVNCSWWGKMIHGEYDRGREAEIRRRQQQEQWRRQQEIQRRQQEIQRRQQEEEARRKKQRGY